MRRVLSPVDPVELKTTLQPLERDVPGDYLQ